MEKRVWAKPEMQEFAFAANEYCASSCGDQNKKYLFECNAPGGFVHLFGKWLSLFNFDELKVTTEGKPDNLGDYEDITLVNGYHPCGQKHEADTTSDFFWGYIDYNGNGSYDASENKDVDETVIVWRGTSGHNTHATKNLDISRWETQKS